ncbi:hypothetical protein GJ744_003365 [Endocarpon pusillum]|uniref:Uncharacterized protein n=1 Tax=Endocarpon pusillum TaxID=364733 RepID=A0A8H7A9Q5_9EURO|nr:hypothetical protein GJ744_003365 [Endocarpon pusillum]
MRIRKGNSEMKTPGHRAEIKREIWKIVVDKERVWGDLRDAESPEGTRELKGSTVA